MNEITIQTVESKTDLRTFLRLPESLYRDDPYWVCPLRVERQDFFNPQKNPFFKDNPVQMFLALRDGRPVGRITAHIYHNHNHTHKERTGFFGFFECEHDYDIAVVLWDHAAAWLREQNMDTMRGPVNFTTNQEAGFLVDGFDTPPVIMMTHTQPYYIEFAERYGLTKAMDLYAYYTHNDDGVAPRVQRIVDRIRQRTGAVIRTLDISRWDDEVAAVRRIYDAAWAPNWGFVPMTDAEFAHMGKEMKQILDPKVILFAEVAGEVVGFSLALPDINQILIKLNGRLLPTGLLRLLWHMKVKKSINQLRVLVMGILPEYQQRGIDHLLHYEIRRRAVARGYFGAEMSWVLETNTMMNSVADTLGARRYKTYRIYDYPLA